MKKIFSVSHVILLLIFSGILLAKSYNPLPRDIYELVNTSDLIVIGTIGEIVDQRNFYGYQENADLMALKDLETPIQLGLPLVDFSIDVEEIIKDDLKFPRSDNDTAVVFRVFLSDEELWRPEQVNNRKERAMFFLTRNPDNETYGVISLMHKVMLGNFDKQPSYSLNAKRQNLPFFSNANGKAFVNKVKKYLSKR